MGSGIDCDLPARRRYALPHMSTATTAVRPHRRRRKTEVSLKDRGNLFEVATKQIEKAMKLINIDQRRRRRSSASPRTS